MYWQGLLVALYKVNKHAPVANDIPNKAAEESQIMRLRRWLKNEKVNAELFYQPLIKKLRRNLSNQPLMLAIDGSTTAGACITLMISLIYKGRALPLVWIR